MKYLAVVEVILGAVLVGFHWHSDLGWFIVLMAAALIINLLIDKENEQREKKESE